jgi:hypothetical protein
MKEFYYYTWDGIKYRYRYDPVPGTGRSENPHRNTGNCIYGDVKYRRPKLRRSLIQELSIDEDLGRMKRRKSHIIMLPFKDVWWEGLYLMEGYVIHQDRCWKSSCKCRKQWMKNLKKHFPTVMERRLDDYYE